MTETVDARIDTIRRAQFAAAQTNAQKEHINTDDEQWLATRGPICAAIYHSGGSIDRINTGRCVYDESATRLAVLTGKEPAVPTGTVSQPASADQIPYLTLPDGSRLAAAATTTAAGMTVTFTVVAGYQGLTLSAGEFGRVVGATIEPGAPAGPPGPQPSTHLGAGQVASWQVSFGTPTETATPQPWQFGYAPAGNLRARLILGDK